MANIEVADGSPFSLDDYSLCDCCDSYSTDTSDTDADGNPLGHVQCGQCSEIAALEQRILDLIRGGEVILAERDSYSSKLEGCRKALREAHKEAMDQASLKSQYQDWQEFVDIIERALGERVNP